MRKLLWLLPFLWCGAAHATCSSVPNTFVPNTTIQSSQVNSNFAALVTCINNIDAGQITTGTLPVGRGGTGITSLTGGSVIFAAGSSALGQDNANFSYNGSTHVLTVTSVSITNLALGLTTGSIPFQGSTNLTQDNSNLFYDNTNKRLLIGDTSAVSGTVPTLQVVLTGSNTTAIAAPFSSSQPGFALNPGSDGSWTLLDHQSGSYTADIMAGSGNVKVSGTFVVGGNYIYLNASGSNCTVNSTGGPCIYADGSTIVNKLPSGSNGFEVQSNSGSVLGQLFPSGNFNITGAYQQGGSNILTGGSTYGSVYNGAGAYAALVLGNSGDPTNYNSNTTHVFRNAAGSTNFATITNAGLTQLTGYVSSTTGSGLNGYQFSSNPSANCCAIEQTTGNTLQAFAVGTAGTPGFVVVTATSTGGGNSQLQMYSDHIVQVGNNGAIQTADVFLQAGGGQCTYAGGSTFSCSSDRRLKRDIAALPSMTAAIDRLKPVAFEMKARPGVKELGFVAQDVERVFPELVSSQNDTLELSYDGLIAPLVKAVQELNARVKTLEAK